MRRLANLSIRHKLSAASLFTSLVVVTFASAALLVTEVTNHRRVLMQQLDAVASIVGGNASAALVFDDAKAAQEILATLAAKPGIAHAALFRPDGSTFARYDRALPPLDYDIAHGGVDAPAQSLSLLRGYAAISAPVRIGADAVGEIGIVADLSQLYTAVEVLLGSMLLVIVASGVGAWFLSLRLQNFFSRPIFQLVEVMRRVSEGKDYALRARVVSHDEVGRLAEGLNAMLARIEEHDTSLRAAWREASAASRAKSEFLANMSHELRTPLNAILGFSELMRREIRGPLGHPTYVDYVTDIHESGKHLLDVISDILDLSKVEAGELRLDLKPLELPQLVRKAVRLIAQRARTAQLDLQVSVEENLPEIEADERLIKQALLNLLSNAVKFTPQGGTVSLSVAAKNESAITITVADTGIGMNANDLPRMFIPFMQVETSLSRKFEGTGLGLPLTKSFVEAHGGTVTLASAPGRGTTATITLPHRAKKPVAPALGLDSEQPLRARG